MHTNLISREEFREENVLTFLSIHPSMEGCFLQTSSFEILEILKAHLTSSHGTLVCFFWFLRFVDPKIFWQHTRPIITTFSPPAGVKLHLMCELGWQLAGSKAEHETAVLQKCRALSEHYSACVQKLERERSRFGLFAGLQWHVQSESHTVRPPHANIFSRSTSTPSQVRWN